MARQVRLVHNSSVTAFIDTNALLHYPPIKEIDWCEVCSADAVTIVLCLPVIKELDRYKADGRLGERAAKRIREILHHQGRTIRPGVSIHIYNVPLRSSEFPDTLSPDEPDDRI